MSTQTGAPCKWTIDGKQYILDNFDMIRESPSEIYNSALALCPSSSWLHTHYPAKAAMVKMVVGPTVWGTCIRTVSCSHRIYALACWKHTIATGGSPKDIVMYDVLTGSQTAILSGHTSYINSLAFSSDGTLLVSGSNDRTIKLWDVQTGGVAKTLHCHINSPSSVSISADSTMIASGSDNRTVCLWNVETGDCLVMRGHKNFVNTVSFSPTNSQILLSSCGHGTVRQWSIDGHQIGSPIAGSYVAFSPDGTQFVSCAGRIITSRKTDSKMTVLQFSVAKDAKYCHFSPNGRFIVVVADDTVYLWDITGPDPCLFQTLIGHTNWITCVIFSSSLLISASQDHTIKFWQIDPSLASPSISSPESSLPASNPIKAVSLQAKDGLAFSIDSEGIVKIWDILTGLCKESVMTPAEGILHGDMRVICGRLVISWHKKNEHTAYLWNAQQGEVQETGIYSTESGGLRISGDGSRVFYVTRADIQSWSMETQELITYQSLVADRFLDPLCMNNSKILVRLERSKTEVWDFGAPGSTSIQLSKISSDKPQLNLVDIGRWSHGSPIRIEDNVTGKDVFQLHRKYADHSAIQWDGRYLITGYISGEVMILDFGQMLVE